MTTPEIIAQRFARESALRASARQMRADLASLEQQIAAEAASNDELLRRWRDGVEEARQERPRVDLCMAPGCTRVGHAPPDQPEARFCGAEHMSADAGTRAMWAKLKQRAA